MPTLCRSETVKGIDAHEPLKWRGFFALMLAMFAVAVGYGIVLPILPFLIERLTQTSESESLSWHTGLLTGTYAAALFLFAPLWGRMSDHYSRSRILLFGLGGFAFTLALFALVDSLPLLYLGRFLSGFFASAVTPVAYAFVGDYAITKEWRAHRFALLNIAGTAGFFLGPMLGGLVLVGASQILPREVGASIPVPFFATSGLAFFATLMVWWLLPTQNRLHRSRSGAPIMTDRRALTLRLLSVSFVTALAVGAFEVGLSLRGKQVLNLDAYQIGMMFTECSLVMFVAQALVFSPLIKPEMTRYLITPSLVVLAAGLAMVPFANGFIATILVVAMVAASAGVLSPIATYWISLSAGKAQGAELGLQTSAASLGQAVGAAAGGLLFDFATIPNASFTLTAALVAAGLVGCIGLPRYLQKIFYDKASDNGDVAIKAASR